MKKTRAQFKLVLRYFRENVEEMKANACAQGLLDFDPQKFGKMLIRLATAMQAPMSRVLVVCLGSIT